jgi:hypothetical protein
MKTNIINDSEVSRLSVAIQTARHQTSEEAHPDGWAFLRLLYVKAVG